MAQEEIFHIKIKNGRTAIIILTILTGTALSSQPRLRGEGCFGKGEPVRVLSGVQQKFLRAGELGE